MSPKIVLQLVIASIRLLIHWILVQRRFRQTGEFVRKPWSGPPDGPAYLMVSLYQWKGIRHRPHHLSAKLAQGHRVLYFHQNYLKQTLIDQVKLANPPPIHWEPVITQPEPNIFVLEATFLSGGNLLEAINRWNEDLMFQLLTSLMDGSPEQWTLVVNDPLRAELTQRLPCGYKVYDILDNYEGFSWGGDVYRRRELATMAAVNLVVAGTHEIFLKKDPQHPNVKFLSCGVDAGHFQKALAAETLPADDIKTLGKPVLFYMGVVDERIDKNLILELAQDFPDGSIVLAGPIVGDFSMLSGLPEVHLLGLRPYSDLPRYLKAADVCLIPFLLNDVTRNINPTKLLEYMAAGKPVVTIDIPDVVKFYKDDVFISHNHEEFVANVHRALGEDGRERVERGLKRAAEFSWDTFAERFEGYLEEIRQ